MATREEDEIAALELTKDMSLFAAADFIRIELGYDLRTAMVLVRNWDNSSQHIFHRFNQRSPAVGGRS